MSYVDSLLGSHETVLRRVHRHPLVMARAVFEALLLTAGGAALCLGIQAVLPQILPLPTELAWGLVALAVAPFAVAVVILVHEWLRWRTDVVLLTNHRLISVTGVLNKSTMDSSLTKINDTRLEQSLLGRVLRYGHLSVLTAAENEAADERMEMLADPAELKRQLIEAKRRLESDRD